MMNATLHPGLPPAPAPPVSAPPPQSAALRTEINLQLAALREIMSDEFADQEDQDNARARMKELRQQLIKLPVA